MATPKIGELKGDSLSRLLQVRAAMKGIHMKWTGNGIEDMDWLCMEYFHRKALNDCLWNGLESMMRMPEMEELKTNHEPIYAQFLSIILRSQVLFELRRAETLGQQPPKTGLSSPVGPAA